MNAHTRRGGLSLRTAAAVAAVWFAIGLAAVTITGSVVLHRPFWITPTIVVGAAAVITAKVLGR